MKHTLLEKLNSMATAPLRICRYLCECWICSKPIVAGEEYRDRGYGRRCHETCLRKAVEYLRRVSENA